MEGAASRGAAASAAAAAAAAASSSDDTPLRALRRALAEVARDFDDRSGPVVGGQSAARKRLEALVDRLKEAAGPALSSLESLNNERKDSAGKVARVVRKQVTGSGERSIRGFIREELQQPPAVRALDKIAFTASILNIMACEFVVLSHPSRMWMVYAAEMVSLIVLRFLYYRGRKWHYFLLDFCYFAQVLCLLQVFVFPNSCALQKANFAFSNGPLAWAVPVWRNSLVFHSMDKVTSTLVHILPSWLMYTLRWYGQQSLVRVAWPSPALPLRREQLSVFARSLVTVVDMPQSGVTPNSCGAFGVLDWLLAIALYLLWQGAYYWVTEIVDKDKLDADPEIQTSLRWLSADTKGGFGAVMLKLCRQVGLLRADEVFDSKTFKTKVIFMSLQFIFTLCTFLPAPLMYSSHTMSVLFLVGIFTCALANASNYYVEVFSRRYYDATMSRGNSKLVVAVDASLGDDDEADSKEAPAVAVQEFVPVAMEVAVVGDTLVDSDDPVAKKDR